MLIRLAVIVVTYNNETTIRECLDSLTRYLPMGRNKVVVVDNDSKDGTREILSSFKDNVEVILSDKNLGFGAGNNLGMKSVDSEYYYLHNSDAYLQDDSLSKALDFMDKERSYGILGLPLVFPDQSPQTSAYSFSSPMKWTLQLLKVDLLLKKILSVRRFGFLHKYLGQLPMARAFVSTHTSAAFEPAVSEVDWVTGASLLLSKDAYNASGGFDEGIFLYGEDEDLCIRARQKGFLVGKINEVLPVIHEFGWGKNKKKKNYNRPMYDSLCYFIDKHSEGRPIRRSYMKFLLKFKAGV